MTDERLYWVALTLVALGFVVTTIRDITRRDRFRTSALEALVSPSPSSWGFLVAMVVLAVAGLGT